MKIDMQQHFIAGILAFIIGLIVFFLPNLIKLLFPKYVKNYFCPACRGDGIERCNNPDHAFISFMGGELARLGCPCCGHDEEHKMKHWDNKLGRYVWNICEECNGLGIVTRPRAEIILEEWEIDEYVNEHNWY